MSWLGRPAVFSCCPYTGHVTNSGVPDSTELLNSAHSVSWSVLGLSTNKHMYTHKHLYSYFVFLTNWEYWRRKILRAEVEEKINGRYERNRGRARARACDFPIQDAHTAKTENWVKLERGPSVLKKEGRDKHAHTLVLLPCFLLSISKFETNR